MNWNTGPVALPEYSLLHPGPGALPEYSLLHPGPGALPEYSLLHPGPGALPEYSLLHPGPVDPAANLCSFLAFQKLCEQLQHWGRRGFTFVIIIFLSFFFCFFVFPFL